MAGPDFIIKVGIGAYRGGMASKKPSAVTHKFAEVIERLVAARGLKAIMAAMVADKEQIRASITADIQRFTGHAARVFTSIKSPTSGMTAILLDNINRGVASSVDPSKPLRGARAGMSTVQWAALQASTIRRKRARGASSPDTFFVNTGDLKQVLEGYMPQAFIDLIDPQVTMTETDKVVRVSLILLAKSFGFAKKGVNRKGLPFLKENAVGPTSRTESLFVQYLIAAGAPNDAKHPLKDKLENPRGSQRAFLQATLAFWLINRMPVVFERALNKALTSKNYKTHIKESTE